MSVGVDEPGNEGEPVGVHDGGALRPGARPNVREPSRVDPDVGPLNATGCVLGDHQRVAEDRRGSLGNRHLGGADVGPVTCGFARPAGGGHAWVGASPVRPAAPHGAPGRRSSWRFRPKRSTAAPKGQGDHDEPDGTIETPPIASPIPLAW